MDSIMVDTLTIENRHKNAFNVLNRGVFVKEGVKASKIRSGIPEGVHNDRLFRKEECSSNRISTVYTCAYNIRT